MIRKTVLILLTIGLMVTVSACSVIPGFSKSSDNVTNKEMTLTFDFGEKTGTYTGELAAGLPQGKGTFTTNNSFGEVWTYQGEWEKGHMQGNGETVWNTGFKQNGVYQNDYLNGAGKEYWDDNLFYDGNYKNGNYDGPGTLTNYYGELVYTGIFSNGFYTETADQRQARLEPFKAKAVELSYPEILADVTSETTGQKIKITGLIFQVDKKNEEDPAVSLFSMYANDDPNQIVRVSYVLNKGEAAPAKDQTVTVWATAESPYTYTSESGSELTVPYVEAWSVE